MPVRLSTEPQTDREGPVVLLIDTCGAAGSIAVARVGGHPTVLAQSELPGRSASERLLPAVCALLAAQGIALGELHAVAVVHGPGSFTGVRVGLSAAKGLCESLAIPMVAISRLAVLAAKVQVPLTAGATVVALLDAGRGEFYAGEYRDGRCLGESLRSRDEVARVGATHRDAVFVACEPIVTAALGLQAVIHVSELCAADALGVCAIRIVASQFDDIGATDANYVRRTDAEIFATPARPPGAL